MKMSFIKPNDCLFNCLQEVKLEKFYGNFVERGLANCDQLAGLSMSDYSRFGVVLMEDRIRLFKLIQVIKSVQADGIYCQHDTDRHVQPPPSSIATQTQTQDQEMRAVEILNGNFENKMPSELVYAPRKLAFDVESKGGNQIGLGKTFIKPINNANNYKVRYERCKEANPNPNTIPDTNIAQKDADSPVFRCRKVLNFSDPDLYSDDEPQSTESDMGGTGLDNNFTSENRILSTAIARSLPVQTKSAISENNIISNSKKNAIEIEHSHSVIKSSSGGGGSQFSLSSGIHSKYTTESEKNHAYFPTEPEPEKAPHIEQIFHNFGYNYGVPDAPQNGKLSKSGAETKDKTVANSSIPFSEKIKVCIRKRPRNTKEIKRNELDVVKVRNRQTIVVEEFKVAVDLTKFIHQHILNFDEIFDEKCNNRDVYDRVVKPLVSSIFEKGSSAICFAFGQTGAGKTHTLMGNKSVPGVYQLAGEDLFTFVQSIKYKEQRLNLWISFYEIYCGHLFDLLNKRKRLHVRENGKQKVCISGLMENNVQDLKSLVQVITYGNSFRSRGNTGVNPHSSRSHAVLQMDVRDAKEKKIGRLTFIDLAGSERASDATNSDRQTRIEGAEINQSLLALKECIRSIDQDSCHTPFRQSKLTHILRDSFVGNSLTVMIANVSPTQSACENTLNTLRYADRVQELKKEATVRGAKNPSPPSFEEAKPDPVEQTIPSFHKFTPSVFHPADIQFSSTPMKSASGKSQHVNGRRTTLAPDPSESPISGHKMFVSDMPRPGKFLQSDDEAVPFNSAASPIPDEQISPVPSTTKNLEYIPPVQNRKRPESSRDQEHVVGGSERPMQDCLDEKVESEQEIENLPCTCRTESCDVGKDLMEEHKKIMSQVNMVLSRARSALENTSGSSDDQARVIFSETQASMKNAEENIREFMDLDKKKRKMFRENMGARVDESHNLFPKLDENCNMKTRLKVDQEFTLGRDQNEEYRDEVCNTRSNGPCSLIVENVTRPASTYVPNMPQSASISTSSLLPSASINTMSLPQSTSISASSLCDSSKLSDNATITSEYQAKFFPPIEDLVKISQVQSQEVLDQCKLFKERDEQVIKDAGIGGTWEENKDHTHGGSRRAKSWAEILESSCDSKYRVSESVSLDKTSSYSGCNVNGSRTSELVAASDSGIESQREAFGVASVNMSSGEPNNGAILSKVQTRIQELRVRQQQLEKDQQMFIERKRFLDGSAEVVCQAAITSGGEVCNLQQGDSSNLICETRQRQVEEQDLVNPKTFADCFEQKKTEQAVVAEVFEQRVDTTSLSKSQNQIGNPDHTSSEVESKRNTNGNLVTKSDRSNSRDTAARLDHLKVGNHVDGNENGTTAYPETAELKTRLVFEDRMSATMGRRCTTDCSCENCQVIDVVGRSLRYIKTYDELVQETEENEDNMEGSDDNNDRSDESSVASSSEEEIQKILDLRSHERSAFTKVDGKREEYGSRDYKKDNSSGDYRKDNSSGDYRKDNSSGDFRKDNNTDDLYRKDNGSEEYRYVNQANVRGDLKDSLQKSDEFSNVWDLYEGKQNSKSRGRRSNDEESLIQKATSLLIASHEEQLTAVTQLCRDETNLLIAVRAGHIKFEDYLKNIQDILLTKNKIIQAVSDRIAEFRI